MIAQYGNKDFDASWLHFVGEDPVHPTLSLQKRTTGNRTIFVHAVGGVAQFMVCARIGNRIPHNMAEVLNDDGYNSQFDIRYAVFYSIFRLSSATLKGAGSTAIKELIAFCRDKGIRNFYTLSPVPQLRDRFQAKPGESEVRQYLETWQGPVARFHLGNGARIHSINFDADFSEQRLNESWGIMVNYDYNNNP